MSRPSSYHESPAYDDFEGFSLPLFNPHPPAVPASRPVVDGSNPTPGHLPPPPLGLQQRHSIHHTPSYSASFAGSGPGPASPRSAGLIPPPSSSRAKVSALPYSVTHQQPSYPTTPRHGHDELMPPPPPASSGLGALARSTSLGARKKDPYAYSSDDVESGLGDMNMHETGWTGYTGGTRPPVGYVQRDQDVVMSPAGAGYTGSPMKPPPIPSQPPTRNEAVPAPTQLEPNPYLPRTSDPGPSSSHWSSSRPSSNRMPSSGSYQSDQLSPYAPPAQLGTSPHSPLLNPYDAPSPGNFPPSPNRSNQWPSSSHRPPSPGSSRTGIPPNVRSQASHQAYPASQPTTPAKYYDPGPPRAPPRLSRSRSGPSRQGFREIRDWSDLKPRANEHPSGRRADPKKLGSYLSPLKCFTTELAPTYTLCSPDWRYETSDNPRRVLTKPSKPMHNGGADNEDWDYILYVNDVLGGEHGGDRYLILDVLGQGTFGQVVKCQNMRTHDICAVKVVKNKPAYLNQSKMEVAILDLLNHQYDPDDTRHILRMLDNFMHKNHLCLVFECLSSNLYELIKQNQFKGLSLQLVKVFTQQLLDCLSVLQEARLIHCDLKPENILLKSLQSPQIKVIDFGSACHEMQTVYTYIQSRFYRSPEVLLGLPYSCAIDMWSLGCIVVELFLGLPLFPGTSEYNQISRIVDMLGNPPGHQLEVGKQTHEFFNFVGIDSHGRKQYQLKAMEQYASEHRTNEQPSKQYFKQTKLKEIIMEYPYTKKHANSDMDKEMAQRRAFVDFVKGLLNLDPIQRWSPQQAAKHPFITGEKFAAPYQPSSVPAKKSYPTPSETPAPAPGSSSSSSSKKYGGLVQSPSASRTQRIYSDAAAYNQQLAHHQSYTAQVQNANAASRQPFGATYDAQNYPRQRMPSQTHQTHGHSQSAWQPMGPPQHFQPRIPSQGQGLSSSASHTSLRGNAPVIAPTNPPPNSYYPASRNRANTINQMDAIPPALARLTHFGAPDPSGTRNLTPVLNRDEAIREWERRQQGGHSKQSSLHNASYPQLEYLQEQAELAAMGNQGWMMPGQYSGTGAGPSGASSHRSKPSTGGQAYQMQPHIGVSPTNTSGVGAGVGVGEYRARAQPSDYDTLPSAAAAAAVGSGQSYLPTYPPPAATSNPSSATFDGFDARDTSMGLMYTPLQPNQPGPYSPVGPGYAGGAGHHQARASYSGPYNLGGGAAAGQNNPFAPSQGGQGQGQPASPRYQRRSQQYGGV